VASYVYTPYNFHPQAPGLVVVVQGTTTANLPYTPLRAEAKTSAVTVDILLTGTSQIDILDPGLPSTDVLPGVPAITFVVQVPAQDLGPVYVVETAPGVTVTV
jgi:hypothetical protein